MTKVLITFGCSWTFGVGVGYDKSIHRRRELFETSAWDEELCNQLSFRGILSQRHEFENINFSSGGSSNQRQFRLAKTFFNSKKFQDLQNNGTEIVVLWGITSTARNEVFMSATNKFNNFMYTTRETTATQVCQFFATNMYSHEHEMFILAHELAHWNTFFNSCGVKNYWYDTFNHHDYAINSPALVGFENMYTTCAQLGWPSWQEYVDKKFPGDHNVVNEILDICKFEFSQFINTLSITNFVIDHPTDRDLMSQLVIRNGINQFDRNYHHSHWLVDGDRVQHLIDRGLLNPFSKHPTKLGHEQIANMFDHLFEKTS